MRLNSGPLSGNSALPPFSRPLLILYALAVAGLYVANLSRVAQLGNAPLSARNRPRLSIRALAATSQASHRHGRYGSALERVV